MQICRTFFLAKNLALTNHRRFPIRVARRKTTSFEASLTGSAASSVVGGGGGGGKNYRAPDELPRLNVFRSFPALSFDTSYGVANRFPSVLQFGVRYYNYNLNHGLF